MASRPLPKGRGDRRARAARARGAMRLSRAEGSLLVDWWCTVDPALLAGGRRRPDRPAMPLAVSLYLLFACLLVLQPDIGQALLVSLVWAALFLLAGKPLRWFFMLAAALPSGVLASYMSLGYVRLRID